MEMVYLCTIKKKLKYSSSKSNKMSKKTTPVKKAAKVAKSRKTVDNLNYPLGTLMVDKKTKAIVATKDATGFNGATDQDAYSANRITCLFMSPRNAKGIAKHIAKYATKFPDYVATLSAIEIPAVIAKAAKAVKEIAKAPVVVVLEKAAKVKAPRKSRAKAKVVAEA